ncbi:MAG: glycosyltransferase family A protein [Candidatus Omnitrophota bacterium]
MSKIGMIITMKIETSVIIPTYNRAYLLKKAIESVLEQTYPHFELIVVDDGSTDDTRKIVSSYGKNIRFFYQGNQGPACARNTGIKNAHGSYLAFLDSDDYWKKDKLKIQIEAMRKNTQYPISHTQEIWFRRGELLNQKKKHAKYNGYIFEKCLPLCAVGMSTMVTQRKLFEKIGFFDESLPCCEDYDFWLRASVNHPFLLIDKALTVKDGGREDQVSRIYAVGMDKFRIKSITNLLKTEKGLSLHQKELALHELEKKCRIFGKGCLKHGKTEEGQKYLNLASQYR